ncbi:hypothetical protein [Chitinophaga pinensis]|uniref:Uncharacterized protein n=1 Tax=Chitinophaga pinensis TaxID=79329 RepID=A0A5C6M2W4_9BACT|nr:hypothetical protein [Chitinophaga pinensis]TWW02349.1 hypothetical protein FEF09_00640 [Chitinophaga pinensis]
MRRIATIAGLLLIVCLTQVSGQTKLIVGPLYPLTKSSKWMAESKKEVTTPVYFSSFQVPQYRPDQHVKSPLKPNDYYDQHFGFFCKKEWNWEKQTQLPVKLRLGTYQEAQRIEGK